MSRHFPSLFLRAALLVALVCILPAYRAPAAQMMNANPNVPGTMDGLKQVMGPEYTYVDQGDYFIVSDLDKGTLNQLMTRDFILYKLILTRDYFPVRYDANARNQRGRNILTVFLFKNRDCYVKGLRKMGIDVAVEDENNQADIRDGYYYSGMERNFILINYKDNYRQGLSIYAHELCHSLMRKDFPDAPIWLDEGIATMVGHSQIVDNRLDYDKRYTSLRNVKRTVENGTVLPLSRLLQSKGTDYLTGEGSTVFYEAGEQFCRFLLSRNQLLQVYRGLRDSGGKGDAGEVLRKVTGLNLEGLEKAWHDWLRRQ